MKIGILTLFEGNYNYGGQLQAFALCKYLRSLGHDAFVIRYRGGKNPIYNNLLEQSKQYGIGALFKKFFEKFIVNKLSFIIKKDILNRKKQFDKFKEENIFYTNEVYNDASLKLLNDEFDAFISGSDQVWNPNALRYGFLQSFVYPSNLKIAYAASLGRSCLSDKESDVLKQYIAEFDYISVREKSAKNILNNIMDNEIFQVLDPTYLVTKNDWKPFISDRIIQEKYVFCYFFSNSKKYRRRIYQFCKKNNYKMVYIPYANTKFNFYDGVGKGFKLPSVGPSEFLSLIYYSEYVFTDSFHGIAFSINFNKEFFVYNRNKNSSKVSMNSRISDTLSLFDLKNRLVSSNSDLNIVKKINYEKINVILNGEREKSIKFLKDALTGKEKYNSIKVVGNRCTQCGNCLSVCPKNAISFIFENNVSKIVINDDKCIKCGICLKICHVLNNNKIEPNTYKIATTKSKESIKSTSGGIFYELAKRFIDDDGIVIGAAMINNEVKHIAVNSIESISLLQGSKYVESSILGIKEFIKSEINKRKILFVGTPCQVASIKRLFQNENNLFLVDILCHGVPEHSVYLKYVKYLENKYHKKIEFIRFRTKEKKLDNYIEIGFVDGKKIIIDGLKDPYYTSFLNSTSLKSSCYFCKYQDKKRVGDISIGDAWGVITNEKQRNSLVLINNEKGNRLFNSITDSICIKDDCFNHEAIVRANSGLHLTHGFIPYKQKKIYNDLNSESFDFFEKKSSFKKRVFRKLPFFVKKIIRRHK